MQDVQQINDGVVGGRLSLLRRLNNHPQQLHEQGGNVTYHLQPQQQQPQQVALKCPRCDSLNTKFCYYNNYNLSQPRHFCKNCRRYWTKGGVLRNVPVGGGCRKSKRSTSSSSKQKSSSSNSSCNSLSSRKIVQSSTHSSSESSSTPPAISGGALFQIPEVENDYGLSSGLENNNNNNNNNLFPGDIGGFMSLITNNNNNSECENSTSVSAAETASFTEFLQNQQAVQEEWDMGKICGVHRPADKIGGSIDLVVDPTVRIEDLLQNRGSNVGFTTLDWHLTGGSNDNQGLYDVPDSSTVDQAAYWSQSTTAAHHIDHQWSDSTTTHLPLFLP